MERSKTWVNTRSTSWCQYPSFRDSPSSYYRIFKYIFPTIRTRNFLKILNVKILCLRSATMKKNISVFLLQPPTMCLLHPYQFSHYYWLLFLKNNFRHLPPTLSAQVFLARLDRSVVWPKPIRFFWGKQDGRATKMLHFATANAQLLQTVFGSLTQCVPHTVCVLLSVCSSHCVWVFIPTMDATIATALITGGRDLVILSAPRRVWWTMLR